LCINGQIDHNLVDLTIADNGIGFDSGGQVDLQSLLTQKRYGLAGMFERAYLINADLAIKSSPGSGTEVRVVWQQTEPNLL
jgi:signal transduction histidine kinase